MDAKINKRDFRELSFEFDELEQMLGELIENCFNLSITEIDAPINLSFTVRINHEGVPKIQSFGKAAVVSQKPSFSLNPISKMEEDDLSYIITIDLLGHEKEEIEAFLEKDALVILSRRNRPFYKKFFLTKPVQAQEVKKTFKNNVLEIVLKKNSESK